LQLYYHKNNYNHILCCSLEITRSDSMARKMGLALDDFRLLWIQKLELHTINILFSLNILMVKAEISIFY
jgi:hypothetical protein